MSDREVMQQALEALEDVHPSGISGAYTLTQRLNAIEALRARLAEPSRAERMRAAGFTRRPTLRELAYADPDPEPGTPARRPLTPVQEAAPELLEALRVALQLIEIISPFFRDDSDFIPYDALLQITKGDVVRNARDAIAKAEGGNDE